MDRPSASHRDSRRCRRCGCLVAYDHAEDSLCSPCRDAQRDYNPFHDPTLADRLLALLEANRRKPINVYQELGIEHCREAAWVCVKNHIARLRRQGHIVIGAHHAYEYRGRRRNASVRRGRRRSR